MKHTYHIHGMTCNGCRTHVEKTLAQVKGVREVSVDLKKAEATITMESHIPISNFQNALKQAGDTYSIHLPGDHHHAEPKQQKKPKGQSTGTYYCPMHCEGDKTYNKPGDCPVCGMDLVEHGQQDCV